MNNLSNELKGIIIFVVYILLQTIVGIVGAMIAAFNGVSIMSSESDMYYMVAYGLIAFIVVVILINRYKLSIRNSLSKVKAQPKQFVAKFAIYFAITWGLLIAFNGIDSLFFSKYITELGDNEEILNQAIATNPSFLLVTGIAIWIPIVEEYVFRYGLINKLFSKLNRYVAAIIVTIIFAFFHIGFTQMFTNEAGYTIHLLLTYLPVSLALNIIYARENDLTIPIIIHIINNSISVIATMTSFALIF